MRHSVWERRCGGVCASGLHCKSFLSPQGLGFVCACFLYTCACVIMVVCVCACVCVCPITEKIRKIRCAEKKLMLKPYYSNQQGGVGDNFPNE